MARKLNRRPTLVRNITIICAVLVVFVMSLERGIVTEQRQHIEVNVDVENQIHVTLDSESYMRLESSDSISYLDDESEDEEVPEARKLTAEPPSIKKLPFDDDIRTLKEDELKQHGTDTKVEQTPTEKEDEPENSKELLPDDSTTKEEVIVTPVDTSKTDGLLNPDPPPAEEQKAPSSGGYDNKDPQTDPKSFPSDPHDNASNDHDNSTPSNTNNGEEDEHQHHHSDEDELPKSTSKPEEEVDLSKLTPEALEKYKNKQAEKAEKEKLEAKVIQEYEDELKNANLSLATPTRSPSASLQLPKPLLFLHIPKTAGSTLAQVFRNNEKDEKYYHFWNQPRVKELHIVPDKDTIFGHFRYGLHFYFNRSVSYATMLRDPVERVVSYYHFHLQDPQDPAHKFAKEHTFEEWLELSPAAQNEMTKCLSGIRSEFYPSMKTFEMAKHHLSKMGYVGLTERFDESLVLMKYYLGFNNLKYHDTKVGVKKPKLIDPEIVEKIKKKNWMDIILYDMAKERFEKELEDVSRYLLQQEVDKSAM